MSDRQCYVFLADVAERNEVLNLYCKVDGYTKEGAIEHVHEALKTRGVAAAYKLLYVGMTPFSKSMMQSGSSTVPMHNPLAQKANSPLRW